eukprot:TRINITY_DN903_c0_g1_i1.p1 TRINITY_DN903_c0_g1~~TRINITY_DN903_c0_g1_i1.p1  ORF type:complete len:223 (-),score=81.13 TRINITY_DN903_c0_g1_i1:60-728(-)
MADEEDINEYFDDLLKVVNDKDGWDNIACKKDVMVFSKQYDDETSIPTLKGIGLVSAKSSDIYKILIDCESRKDWDLFYEEGNILMELSENTGLAYSKTKSQYTVWPRDLVLLYSGKETDHGHEQKEISLVARSVEIDEIEEVEGFVRAKVLNGGFNLKPVEGHENELTLITYVFQIDIGGWIPSSVANMINTYQPLSIIGIRKYMTKSTDPPENFSIKDFI